jgi:hypothetical protein
MDRRSGTVDRDGDGVGALLLSVERSNRRSPSTVTRRDRTTLR